MAGLQLPGSALLEADCDHSRRTFDVNVMGTFWTIKLLARHLVDTETHGSIVTIASLNGQGIYVPVQPCSAYNASKAAVKGMVGPLAGELGEYGIRINSISPGKATQVLTMRRTSLPARCHPNTVAEAPRRGEGSYSRLL